MNIVDELRAQANQHQLDADLTMFDVAATKIDEQQAHIERLRTMLTRVMSCDDLILDSDVVLTVDSELKNDIEDTLNETPAHSLEALKREWQVEILNRAVNEFTHEMTEEFCEIQVGIIKKGRGFLYAEGLLQFIEELKGAERLD